MRATLIIRLIEAVRQGADLDAMQYFGQLVNEETRKGNKAVAEELMNAWNGKAVNYDRFKPPAKQMITLDPMEQQRWQ